MSGTTSIEWTECHSQPVHAPMQAGVGGVRPVLRGPLKTARWHGPLAFTSGPPVLQPAKLLLPWLAPYTRAEKIFAVSMSDAFHSAIPLEDLALLFAMMAADRRHIYQMTTKRPGVMRSRLSRPEFESTVRAALRTLADLALADKRADPPAQADPRRHRSRPGGAGPGRCRRAGLGVPRDSAHRRPADRATAADPGGGPLGVRRAAVGAGQSAPVPAARGPSAVSRTGGRAPRARLGGGWRRVRLGGQDDGTRLGPAESATSAPPQARQWPCSSSSWAPARRGPWAAPGKVAAGITCRMNSDPPVPRDGGRSMTGQAPLEGELRLRVIRTPAGPLVCCLCTAEPAFHETDGTLHRDGAAAAVVRMAAHARACTDPGAARLPGELPLRITHTGAGLQIRCPCGAAASVTQAGPGPGTPATVRPAALPRMVAHLSTCRRAQASASAGPPAPPPASHRRHRRRGPRSCCCSHGPAADQAAAALPGCWACPRHDQARRARAPHAASRTARGPEPTPASPTAGLTARGWDGAALPPSPGTAPAALARPAAAPPGKPRRRGVQGTVYLLHFAEPYGPGGGANGRGTARHYTGWARGGARGLARRLARHGTSEGARLMQVVQEAGITWEARPHLARRPEPGTAAQAARRRVAALPVVRRDTATRGPAHQCRRQHLQSAHHRPAEGGGRGDDGCAAGRAHRAAARRNRTNTARAAAPGAAAAPVLPRRGRRRG